MAAWFRIRLGFVFMLFVGFFATVGFRLAQLQIFQDTQLENLGRRQFRKISSRTSFRLPIYDRNQEELAVSVPAGSVYARPKLIKQRRKTARALAKYLGGSADRWLFKLQEKKPFVWIQRQVSSEKAQALSAAKLPGIFVESETKRFYPNATLASQLLGFTDVDGNGLAGIELKYNKELFGDERSIALQRDGKGNPTYIEKQESDTNAPRVGVSLTIDRRLQYVVEEELEHALSSTGAKNVMAIVMDPTTGEILAMGQRPSFDPNRPNQSAPTTLTNTAVSSLYEPGSTMKVLVAAEAIEAGLLKKDSVIDCGGGVLRFGNKTIHEAESDHAFKSLSLEKVIQYSSNVGAARIGETLGVKRIQKLMEKYHLTSKTGIELPAEITSAEKEDKIWRPIFLATASFGQGISVTPLQMVTAFAPFANGGYEVKPHILNDLPVEDKKVRLLSPKTVAIMREILVGVTESKDGTGVKARVTGMRVAGKTGTAQKYVSGAGYDGKKYFSSFIGFLPAEKPQLLIGVMVDEPKFPYYASQVAAPVFKNVADRAMQLLDKTPKQVVEGPPVQEKPIRNVAVFKPKIMVESETPGVMPDLSELSVRDALRVLSQYPNQVKVTGDGFMELQEPAPGTPITPETQFNLRFHSDF